MWLVVEKHRIALEEWMPANAIEAKAKTLTTWPPNHAWVEWERNNKPYRLELFSDAELYLVCRMLSCMHEQDDETHRMEAKAKAHMEAPDSDTEDEVVSEDDMTMDYFEAVGMRHTFYYE